MRSTQMSHVTCPVTQCCSAISPMSYDFTRQMAAVGATELTTEVRGVIAVGADIADGGLPKTVAPPG